MMKRKILALISAALLLPAVSAPANATPEDAQYEALLSSLPAEDRAVVEDYVDREMRYQTQQHDGPLVINDEGETEDLSSRAEYQPRTLSPFKDKNKFVGELWNQTQGLCTANHIRGSFWLTAKHCFRNGSEFNGYIKQYDGTKANVLAVYLHPNATTDLAMVRVSSGLSPETPALSKERPKKGTRFAVTGYGGQRDGVPTRSVFFVTDYDKTYGKQQWHGLMEIHLDVPLPHATVGGDSGSGLFAYPTTLHGVLSGGSKDPKDPKYRDYATPVADHLTWINETMKTPPPKPIDVVKPLDPCLSFCWSSSGISKAGVETIRNLMEEQ
ncbi:hypothetical protein C1Y63_05615 [Corynebacterium sp. 13CS0277]|uniref:trypsin-like serine protease n=1 Tax=Corynebacterium sp. 13CS0277 TaxID=2071994 RepID=UPI000D037426|nr:trypsin-like serine protease [Corynebacterium sp. 13CS0277]PRQ11481.1 hypothetical protein C1Y63_05615 [Corynebacterium sp. 13CS0277]